MASGLRHLLAARISDVLSKKSVLLDINRLAWCVRINPGHKQQSGCDVHLTVPFEHLQSCGVLPAMPWTHKLQWAHQVANEVSDDDSLQEFGVGERCFTAKVNSKYFAKEILQSIITEKSKYGLSSELHNYCLDQHGDLITQSSGQNVVVEYSSPNIAKPFHAGHLRSTILGNFIANINRAMGHKVVAINYLGNWGTQFGLLGVGIEKYGCDDQMKTNAMKHLFEVYVKINRDARSDPTIHQQGMEFFSRMEQGDKEALSLWKWCQDCSIEEYSKVYQRLGVAFDVYDGEAQYHQQSHNLIERLRLDGSLQYHDNSQVGYVDLSAPGEKKQLYANLVKSDGTTLYITRDIVAAVDRYERYQFDRIHYVVENGQYLHFQQLVGYLKKFRYKWAERCDKDFHVKFGRIEGMSTRRGEVVFLEDILDEAKARMIETMKSKETTKVTDDLEEVADQLGTCAVIIQDLKEKRLTNYKFNWDRMLQFQGDTGVFLQYTHARLCSLERNCGFELDLDCSLEALHEPTALGLIQHLARYDEILHKSFTELEPSFIVRYLFQLGHQVGKAHDKLRVKGQPGNIAQARLLLFHCSRITLASGLNLLGMNPLERI